MSNSHMHHIATAMHLVRDEIEEFPGSGKCPPGKYRFRIYQTKGQWPVIVVSPVGDSVIPMRMSARLANFANQALCGFYRHGFHYYETGNGDPECEVHEVFFEYFGYSWRLAVFNPLHKKRSWGFLEAIVGCPVDRA